jgi:putative endonuclease
MKNYFVYILCSKRNGTLYVGITSDLNRRAQEHREKLIPGFTQKYSVVYLVYFESFESIFDVIKREKQIKKWHRSWKIELIEKNNPAWIDLFTSKTID